jgi:DNA-binding FadR family transcriptional regulator
MAAVPSRANRASQGKAFAAKLRVTGDVDRSHEGKIHGSVVDAIGRWILGGTYAPNDLLPREDDLAVELGVSRTSIREAVKVLSAKGLLQARRRVGVRVRNRDDWNLLDPQVLSWHPDVGRDEALKTSLIEARRIIEPAAAALAARRATAVDLVQIEQAYLGMERNVRTDPSLLRSRPPLPCERHRGKPQRGPKRLNGDYRGGPSCDLRDHQSPDDGSVSGFGRPPGGFRVHPHARRRRGESRND